MFVLLLLFFFFALVSVVLQLYSLFDVGLFRLFNDLKLEYVLDLARCTHDELVHHFEKLVNIPDEDVLPDTCPLDVNGEEIINDVLNKDIY